MCGIAGFVDRRGRLDAPELRAMTGTLVHRGPDADGHVVVRDDAFTLGLGHRRLSILDLSTGANQPFASDCGNYRLVYNGEIYNFAEIRKELEALGHAFHTRGDTEVLLHALMEWGGKAVHKCIGMFAFAFHDTRRRKLLLCRDRAGVKPLYYYRKDGLFLFASELKAFHSVPGFEKRIDPDALGAFFRHAYIPAPLCIFRDARKLPGGHFLSLDLDTLEATVEPYWDIIDFHNQPRLELPDAEAIEETERLMTSAFRYRMVSDVPVGVFLSGGYDSALVTALLQKDSARPLRTFTIGFDEHGFDEAPAARAIARHLGTEHHEYYCTPADAAGIIPQLPDIYDEPFGNSSAIPTTLVSRISGRHAKVVLSGEGGDETFCGYPKYVTSARIHALLGRVPSALRPGISRALLAWESIGVLPARHSPEAIRLGKIAELLRNGTPSEVLRRSSFYFNSRELERLLDFTWKDAPTSFDDAIRLHARTSPIEKMLAIDFKTYLGEDILTKVDRATMAASIEGREPFLDHRLSEWAARLPMRFKLRNGEAKWICRQILHRHVPKAMMERPKMGFAVPIFRWLAEDLQEAIRFHLEPGRIAAQGYLRAAETAKLVRDFQDDRTGPTRGRNEKIQRIWLLLMFQMWHTRWMEN